MARSRPERPLRLHRPSGAIYHRLAVAAGDDRAARRHPRRPVSRAARAFGGFDGGALRRRFDVRWGVDLSRFAVPVRVERSRDTHRKREIGRHTSELQSLMRISYAVFCLKKKKKK